MTSSSTSLARAIASTFAVLLTAACGGTTSQTTPPLGNPDAGASPDAAAAGGDAATAGDSGDGAPSCAQVEGSYAGLGSTPAYLSCATSSDCSIVSSDICYDTPTLALNAAGVAAANALGSEFQTLGQCGRQDCGSGGGGGVSAVCTDGKCATGVGVGGDAGP